MTNPSDMSAGDATSGDITPSRELPGATTPADMTNEEIRTELSSIAIVLADNPPDDLGPLIERREALRNEVRARPATPADVENLQRELVGLKKRIGVIDDERINPAAMSDGGDGGDGPKDAQEIAWTYDEATGRAAIVSRITHIEQRLADADSA